MPLDVPALTSPGSSSGPAASGPIRPTGGELRANKPGPALPSSVSPSHGASSAQLSEKGNTGSDNQLLLLGSDFGP